MFVETHTVELSEEDYQNIIKNWQERSSHYEKSIPFDFEKAIETIKKDLRQQRRTFPDDIMRKYRDVLALINTLQDKRDSLIDNGARGPAGPMGEQGFRSMEELIVWLRRAKKTIADLKAEIKELETLSTNERRVFDELIQDILGPEGLA